MALEVGTAHLQIIPSLRGLHKKIQAEVAKVRDIEIDVEPDMGGFREKVERATRGVGALDVEVDVDATRARAQVGAFAQQMKARLDAATRSLGDIRIDGDADPIERKIWMVRQQLATLRNQRIGLDIDADEAQREIARISAELSALSRRSPNIQVKVDSATAVAQLAALNMAMNRVDRQGGALRATLAAVGSGVGLLRSGIGSLVSGLGSLVGEGTRAGSAMISLGSSIGDGASGAAGSMSSLGRGAMGAVAAFGQLAVAGAGIVALGSLIAGAGAVAVAAIGQLGGAVIALASGLVPLTGMLGTLPGLLLPVGLAAGAVAIAFGDEGLKKEAEQLKEAFKPLVTDIRDQLRPALTGLLESVEGLVPVFRRAAPAITSAISDVTRGFSEMFRSSSFKEDLESILRASGQTIRDFGDTARSGMRAFMDIMISASPVVEQLTLFIKNGAAEFANWTAEARRSGELTTFFSQAFAVFRDLMGVLGNLTGLFKDFWDSANRTGAFTATLGAINEGITRFRDYTNEAGGAWDQLMTKAGPITASLVGLVESIGKAFVEMGAKVDIVPLFDRISTTITNLTPVFADIANKAVPAFEKIVTAGEKLMVAIGPEIGETITKLATAFEGMAPSLETIIPFLGDMAVEIGKIIIVVGNFIDHLVTLPSIVKSALSGDFAGAAEKWRGLQERTREVTETMQELNTKAGETKGGVEGVGGALNDLPSGTTFTADVGPLLAATETATAAIVRMIAPRGNVVLNADAAKVISVAGTVTAIVERAAQSPPPIVFNGNPAPLIAAAGAATTSIAKLMAPRGTVVLNADAAKVITVAGTVKAIVDAAAQSPPPTVFTGDAGPVQATVQEAVAGIRSVPPSGLTTFFGDILSLRQSTIDAMNGIAAVPSTHGSSFTGDPGPVMGAAGQATGAINAVPPNHHTPITGDAGSAVDAAGQATGAINGVPDRSDTDINARDNASGVIARVQGMYDRLPRFVQTVIETVHRIVNAEGGIVAPMATGGVLPMAEGDAFDRLRPMSGRSARIVPPNTWRVIGDRMVDDEAFIPINDSAWSTAILGETARRKGFALAPMAGGGQLRPGDVVVEDDPRWLQPTPGPGLVWGNPAQHARAAQLAGGPTRGTMTISVAPMAGGGINDMDGMELYRYRKVAFDKHRREWARTHPGQENTNTTVRQFWPEYADAVARGFRGTVQQFYSQYQPSGRGGRHGSRDERAWEWVRKLLEGIRGRPGGGGSPGIPGGGVGGPAGPAPVGRLPQAMLRTTFATASGMASMTRANPLYAPMPYRPFAPDPGREVGRALSNISFGPTGSRWLDDLLEEVANKIRSRGGDSRILYSRR